MVDVIIKHVQQDAFLRALECLDQEPIVVGEEEKGPTLACSLSSLEHHVAIGIQRKGIHHVLRRNVVELHQPLKLLIFVTLKSRL